MKFDQLLTDHVGTMGRFQLLVVAIVCYEDVYMAMQVMAPVFLAGVPDHWCHTSQANDVLPANCSRKGRQILTDPFQKNPNTGVLQAGRCQLYNYNMTHLKDDIVDEACYGDPDTAFNRSKLLYSAKTSDLAECTSWDYGSQDVSSTVVTEWDLVCGRKAMAGTVSAMFLGGRAAGNFVFGWMADRYGRRKVIMLCGISSMVCAIVCALSPFYLMFVIVRFFQAFFATGKSTIAFVVALEYTGPDRRVPVGVYYSLCWSVGYMVLAPMAYFIRDWRKLLIAITIPEVTYCVLFYFWVPESPRWLYFKQRDDQANRTVVKMAKLNRRKLPAHFAIDIPSSEKIGMSPLDLFRTKQLCFMTTVWLFIWAGTIFVYYGLSFNSSNLGGSPYVSLFIAAAVEIPASLSILFSFGKFGRVWPLSISLGLCGLTLLTTMAVPADLAWLLMTLSMVGKFFITAACNMTWIYCTECYPTCIRNMGLTVTSIGGRVASPISPYIGLLADTHRVLPLLVCGVIALICGGLALTLPETHGQPLAQNIDEAEEFIKNHKLTCCRLKGRMGKVTKQDNDETTEEKMLNNRGTMGETIC